MDEIDNTTRLLLVTSSTISVATEAQDVQ